jgi:hypothetical protein
MLLTLKNLQTKKELPSLVKTWRQQATANQPTAVSNPDGIGPAR